jgi:protocatechuate 3,4-dioxygenase beta subunit
MAETHHTEANRSGRLLTRRDLLLVVGGSLLILAGCGSDDGGVPVDESGPCPPTPKQDDEAYIDEGALRSDILDGQKGVPLDLWVKVLKQRSCEPLVNAAVEVWAANSAGKYSDRKEDETVGQKFLRGIQLTDATGFVKFRMVYPGWQRERAPHVNVKVRIGGAMIENAYTGGNLIHTGQMFFPPESNEAVRNVYADNSNQFVNNNKDRIYRKQGGIKSGIALEGSIEAGFAGTIALDVAI